MAARQQHHALVLPFPLQGHISPLMQLSEHLAASHGFRITFVNTEHNHYRMVKGHNGSNKRTNSNISMVGLSDGLPVEVKRKASDMRREVESMEQHMSHRLEELISHINLSSCPITCIIADIFMHWVPQVAKRVQVPVLVGFHASSIAQFSFLYHIPLLLSSGQVNPDGTTKDELTSFTGLPGVVDVPVSAATWLVGDAKRNEEAFKALAAVSKLVEEFDVLLFNSFSELEKETVDALVVQNGRAKQLKMMSVGPMLLLDSKRGTEQSEPSSGIHVNGSSSGVLIPDEGCIKWLQRRADRSVLYIAFGTTAWLSVAQLHELALGIEASKVPFLWVLRPDMLNAGSAESDGSAGSQLPQGFLERTRERAYITSWAPQTSVLSHAAVGAFLSHGGWNSTLEAISAGVPMLVFPDFWDQKFHAEQVVKQWKTGLLLRRPASLSDGSRAGQLLRQQEVERLVRCVMEGEEGVQMRARASALSHKARLAVSKDVGCSHRNMVDVIRYLESRLSGHQST